MLYAHTRRVEFNHCDAAGIVFYPRYFEMIAAVHERFFAEALCSSWADMVARGTGTPMGRINVEFAAPSRLGDTLNFTLVVTRIGGASVDFLTTCHCSDELRFSCTATLVHATLEETKSLPWPDGLKTKMAAYQQERKNTE